MPSVPALWREGRVPELPDGAWKKAVESACSTCHGTNLLTTSTGYTHERWDYVISKMMELPDRPASEITQYLAANFPESYDRRPTLVAGDTSITFLEWNVPTLGRRPRDPLQTLDGTIGWAGMYGSLIGRLDPKTGEIQEWPLPSGPKSHPYAIEVIDDIIWYNESHQRPDALVRFDPNTEEFQSWPIPSGIGILRHMRATPEGNLVIHQSSTNTVGLVMIAKNDS